MDKLRRLELMQRSLGLRHKLKVHESMKQPDNHEDIAIMLITKWEFEDEIRAIEEVLQEERHRNVQTKKNALVRETIEEEVLEGKADAPSNSREPDKKTKKPLRSAAPRKEV
jgi:HD-like signal output (HDOD) protein